MRSIDVEAIVGNLGESLRDGEDEESEEDLGASSGVWGREGSCHDDSPGPNLARGSLDEYDYA